MNMHCSFLPLLTHATLLLLPPHFFCSSPNCPPNGNKTSFLTTHQTLKANHIYKGKSAQIFFFFIFFLPNLSLEVVIASKPQPHRIALLLELFHFPFRNRYSQPPSLFLFSQQPNSLTEHVFRFPFRLGEGHSAPLSMDARIHLFLSSRCSWSWRPTRLRRPRGAQVRSVDVAMGFQLRGPVLHQGYGRSFDHPPVLSAFR
mmetsp:Transcript_5293/g.11826  ORF Transcript_5293/g.11826 Transcript_5293/m.11826 type:complete len:201 (-) Transcript_5293:4364-4966(-)